MYRSIHEFDSEGIKTLVACIGRQAGDFYLVKKRFSAFIQGSSNIEAFCMARGIDTLLIAGTASNGCCESTARDATMLNFKVAMISDASATDTDELHSVSMRFFYQVYGDVLTVDEAIAGLVAAAPERLRSA